MPTNENGARGSLDFLSTDENQPCAWVELFWPETTDQGKLMD